MNHGQTHGYQDPANCARWSPRPSWATRFLLRCATLATACGRCDAVSPSTLCERRSARSGCALHEPVVLSSSGGRRCRAPPFVAGGGWPERLIGAHIARRCGHTIQRPTSCGLVRRPSREVGSWRGFGRDRNFGFAAALEGERAASWRVLLEFRGAPGANPRVFVAPRVCFCAQPR